MSAARIIFDSCGQSSMWMKWLNGADCGKNRAYDIILWNRCKWPRRQCPAIFLAWVRFMCRLGHFMYSKASVRTQSTSQKKSSSRTYHDKRVKTWNKQRRLSGYINWEGLRFAIPYTPHCRVKTGGRMVTRVCVSRPDEADEVQVGACVRVP